VSDTPDEAEAEAQVPGMTDAIDDEELLDPQPELDQPEGAEEDGPDPTDDAVDDSGDES
jgi:hypothetical protein